MVRPEGRLLHRDFVYEVTNSEASALTEENPEEVVALRRSGYVTETWQSEWRLLDDCITEGFFNWEGDKIHISDLTQARIAAVGRLLMSHARPPLMPDTRRRRAWGAEGRYDHTFHRRSLGQR